MFGLWENKSLSEPFMMGCADGQLSGGVQMFNELQTWSHLGREAVSRRYGTSPSTSQAVVCDEVLLSVVRSFEGMPGIRFEMGLNGHGLAQTLRRGSSHEVLPDGCVDLLLESWVPV